MSREQPKVKTMKTEQAGRIAAARHRLMERISEVEQARQGMKKAKRDHAASLTVATDPASPVIGAGNTGEVWTSKDNSGGN